MTVGSLWVTLGVDASGLWEATGAVASFGRKVDDTFNRTTNRIRTFGYLASITLTAPLVMAGKEAFNLYKEYEFAMQKIAGLTGESQKQVDEWSKQLLRLGPQLARAPQELADAMYFVASSGFKGAEALDIVTQAAKGASSGLGETKTIADLVTSAMSAYKESGLSASRTMDILTAAIREGKAEADSFTRSIGATIPFAAELGVSFDQVAGAMAAMTLTGSSAANASTYLRNIFKGLMDPSKHVEKALQNMGTSADELRNMLGEQGLMPTLLKIRQLTEKYGDSMMTQVFPNIRAVIGVLSLLGDRYDENIKLMDRVTYSAGDAAKALAAQAETVKFKLNAAVAASKAAWTTFGKTVAEAVLPWIQALSKALQWLVKIYEAMPPVMKRLVIGLAAFAAALGPVALGIATVRYLAPFVAIAFDRITASLVTLRAAMMTNPWLALLTLLAALAASLLINQKRARDFAASQRELNDELKSAKGAAVDASKAAADLGNAYNLMNTSQLGRKKELINFALDQERDLTVKLAAEAIKRLKMDTEIAKMQAEIDASTNELYKAGLIQKLTAHKNFLIADLNMEFEASKERVRLLEEELKKVNKLFNRKKTADEMADAAAKAWTDMQVEEDLIKARTKAYRELGIEYNATSEYLQLYTKSIKEMIDNGVTPADERMKYMGNRLKDLKKFFIEGSAAGKEFEKMLKDLQNSTDRTSAMPQFDEAGTYQRFMMRTQNFANNPAAENKAKYLERITKQFASAKEEADALSQALAVQGETFYNVELQAEYYDALLKEMKLGLEIMAIKGEKGTEAFKTLSSQMRSLEVGMVVADALSDAFSQLFSAIIEGGRNMSEVLLQIVKALVTQIISEFARSMITKLVMNIVTGGLGAGASAAANFQAPNVIGMPSFATGGVVPQGYPNDSFVARLSSGEMVLPAGLAKNLVKNDPFDGQVVFEISQDKLVGILAKATKKNGIY